MFGSLLGTRLLRGLHAQVILAVVMAVVSVGLSQPSSAAATEQGTITSTNLLTNGGFESGASIPPGNLTLAAGSTDIAGWTVSQGDIDYVGDGRWEASEGTRSLDLNGFEAGGIKQTFTTVAGASYLVSLDMAGNPEWDPPQKTMTVKASGQSTTFTFDTSGKSRSVMGWENHTWTFTAASESTTLEFESATSGSYGGPTLDNVSVQSSYLSRTVTSDSYTMLKYIPTPFSISKCINNLTKNRIPNAVILCGFLKASANTTPPASFNQASLASFIASKEYRAYIHIPAYTVTCVGGSIQSMASADHNYNFEDTFSWSLGYTKVIEGDRKTGYKTDYYMSERYLADSSVGGPAVDITYAPNRSFVDVSFASASRLSTLERIGNYGLTGYDSPFIWTNFRERISCDGSRAASVAYNNFPTTNTYVNGQQVSSDPISDIAKFLKQGGKVLNPVGYGPLAGPCHTEVFASGTALPWNPTDLCLIPDYI